MVTSELVSSNSSLSLYFFKFIIISEEELSNIVWAFTSCFLYPPDDPLIGAARGVTVTVLVRLLDKSRVASLGIPSL